MQFKAIPIGLPISEPLFSTNEDKIVGKTCLLLRNSSNWSDFAMSKNAWNCTRTFAIFYGFALIWRKN